MTAQPRVLFVLGGPGSGKGTQCANIVRDYGHTHLSAGDLLREERASGSQDGDLIENFIKEGKIVPIKITVKLLAKAMEKHAGCKFLIDGFPRNQDNMTGWQSEMEGRVQVEGVLFFDCPEEVCVERIIERGKSSGRVDDNIESIRKRFKTFYGETMPVVEQYKKINMVHVISAVPAPEEVYANVRKVMDNISPK